jgi:uncharacterized protein (TIGR02145 family)
MKRVTVLSLLISLSLFVAGQDKNFVAFYKTSGITFADTLGSETRISENNMGSEETYVIADGDGNVYNSVRIGNQVWMTENLRTTRFNDGTEIPLVTGNQEWRNLVSPGYCWYNNNNQESDKDNFGALYNWHAVRTGKLCPSGWHVPDREEWNALINFSGDDIAGISLKDTGNIFWNSHDQEATNSTGFTARPGGIRWDLGQFSDLGIRGRWWSTTEYNSSNVWNTSMSSSYKRVTGSLDDKNNGYSVRCIKDNLNY